MEETNETPKPPVPPAEIDFAEADISRRYDDVYEIRRPNTIASVQTTDEYVAFVCENGISLRISGLSNGALRFRYNPNQEFEADFSYALRAELPTLKLPRVQARDTEYLLLFEGLQVVVAKDNLAVRIYDDADQLLLEDAGGYSAKRTIMKGWCDLRIEKQAHAKEVFWGLGDKTCGVNLRGKRYENWCTDSYGFSRESDALYRAIPLYYGLHHAACYGIFLDNSYRSWFDFCKTAEDQVAFGAEGGALNFYFLPGPTPEAVAERYTQLTGTHPLPPLWALGYHQCRWSYYPESQVLDLADTFRRMDIPCDAIYLDIDYMDGYRCFTWNREHFPDPKRLVDQLRARGFETVVMIDPGIKEDENYLVYREGREKGMFIRTPDGDIAKGPVWPGFCAFPDYTNPKVREWWGELYRELYEQQGISGFWNDMNEPAVFHVNHKTLPDQVLHDHDGLRSNHRRAHNIYGMQMSRASWDGLRRIKPEKRPFLLTRATFSGGQRFGALWTGDNFSTWEHLQIANIQCQRLAVSGFSFVGTDIGGFAGELEPELFIRWLQLAVFHPLMRVHSMGQHTAGDVAPAEEAMLTDPDLHRFEQEPWSFGDKYTAMAKKAIELRYCLLPALYTAMWRHAEKGTPVLRHIAWADPAEPRFREQERDFLFGEHLLVSPVVQPKTQRQAVLLPKGNWYYFWTGQAFSGETVVNTMPDQIPFFVREGAVLPVYPVRQWTGQKPIEELTLYVYFKQGREESTLYEDAGEGYEYQDGDYCLQQFSTLGEGKNFRLERKETGKFQVTYKTVKLYLVGFPAFVGACRVNGQEVPIKEIRLRDRSLYTLNVPSDFEVVVWEGK